MGRLNRKNMKKKMKHQQTKLKIYKQSNELKSDDITTIMKKELYCIKCGEPTGITCVCGDPICYDCAKNIVVNGENIPACPKCYMITLPIIEVKGKKYYLDKRLQQLRNITNPCDFKNLCSPCMGDANKIFCPYYCDPRSIDGQCAADIISIPEPEFEESGFTSMVKELKNGGE